MTDTAPSPPATDPAQTAALLSQLMKPPPPASPEALEFVHNGIIRFHFPTGSTDGDRIVRVRRPFLGELKALRLSLADHQDTIREAGKRIAASGEALKTEAAGLDEDLAAKRIDQAQFDEGVADIRRRDSAGAREMDGIREDEMLAWFARVFDTLAVDDVPDAMEYPSWILDPTLPGRCLSHWRNIPSGPG